tara:strand:+ start:1161 stop:3458 length:2298 start_codon:yes stop_codon:yes gene_type:complete
MSRKTKFLAGSSCALLGLLSAPLQAQEQIDGNSASTYDDGVIIVTAQRREQQLLDVPISVSAVNNASLERAQVRTVSDIATIIPNIQINQTIGNSFGPLITIRGLSPSADTSLARDQPVGLYLDGVPIAKSTGAAFDTVDLERVEVLRGPQGTLYGKNTIGGAVNLITQKPTGEFGGQLLGGAGSFGHFYERLTLNLPEVAGFSVKLGVSAKQREGYYRNTARSTDFGEEELVAARADVLWQPSDNFSALYSYDISDSRGTPAMLAPAELGVIPFANALIEPFIQTGRPRGIAADSAILSNYRVNGHALTMELDLGGVTLKSISARRTMATRSASDFDGTPIDLLRIILNNDYEQYSQELQAIGDMGDFTYTAGLFYLENDYDVFNPRWNFQFGGDAFDSNVRSGGSKTYAAYGQLSWTPSSLDDRLTLSLGGRYTRESKYARARIISNSNYRIDPSNANSGIFVRNSDGSPVTISGQPAAGARPGAGGIGPEDLIPLEQDGVWKKFNPEFNALFKITSDFSIYGRYATGFKSGGINDSAPSNAAFENAFDPENLTSFELGAKLSAFDSRLNLNVAGYHSIYKDFQAGVFVPALVVTNIINAGEAQFTGFEVEGSARIADSLSFTFGAGYVNARYTDFVLPDGTDVTDIYTVPLVPKWNYQVGAIHKADVGIGTLESSLNWSWRSRQDGTINRDPLSYQKPYGLLDGRIALRDIELGKGASLEIAAWGKNLTDKEYWTSSINLTVLTIRQWADPRSFGGELRLRF